MNSSGLDDFEFFLFGITIHMSIDVGGSDEWGHYTNTVANNIAYYVFCDKKGLTFFFVRSHIGWKNTISHLSLQIGKKTLVGKLR